jgi:hypothetical protein
MSENDTTVFCILIQIINEDFPRLFTVFAQLPDALEDPYLMASALSAITAPLNQVDQIYVSISDGLKVSCHYL